MSGKHAHAKPNARVLSRAVIQRPGLPFKDWAEISGAGDASAGAGRGREDEGLFFRDVLEYLRNGPRPMRMHFVRNTPSALAQVPKASVLVCARDPACVHMRVCACVCQGL